MNQENVPTTISLSAMIQNNLVDLRCLGIEYSAPMITQTHHWLSKSLFESIMINFHAYIPDNTDNKGMDVPRLIKSRKAMIQSIKIKQSQCRFEMALIMRRCLYMILFCDTVRRNQLTGQDKQQTNGGIIAELSREVTSKDAATMIKSINSLESYLNQDDYFFDDRFTNNIIGQILHSNNIQPLRANIKAEIRYIMKTILKMGNVK